jgi:hypothetical protein
MEPPGSVRKFSGFCSWVRRSGGRLPMEFADHRRAIHILLPIAAVLLPRIGNSPRFRSDIVEKFQLVSKIVYAYVTVICSQPQVFNISSSQSRYYKTPSVGPRAAFVLLHLLRECDPPHCPSINSGTTPSGIGWLAVSHSVNHCQ